MQLEIRQRIITYVLHERCTKRPNNTDSANNRCELINLTSLGSFFFPSNWVNAHFPSALELIWTPIAFRLSLTPSLPACPDSSHIICPPSTIHFLTVYSHPPPSHPVFVRTNVSSRSSLIGGSLLSTFTLIMVT